MNAYRIRPVKYPWPTVFYFAAILMAYGLHRIAPFHLPDQHMLLLQVLGGAMGFIGVYLVVWASIMLLRSRTAVLSNRSAARLVIRGPFRYTRNPIYLGYTLGTMGIGLITGNAWFFIMATLAAISTTMIGIRHEEMHLHARFGIEYERYCRRTRRWL